MNDSNNSLAHADDSSAQEFMLSTTDNPFDPSTHFKEWYAYDVQNGHHTSSLLARMIHSSNELSESMQNFLYKQAMTEIIANDVEGIYVLVPVRNQNPPQNNL